MRAVPAAVLLLVLAGCGRDGVEPAPDGGSPACTALTDRLPAKVLDRPRRNLSAAGAAAWGDPSIVLRCGVPATGPTTNPCLEVGGLDWTLAETSKAFRFTTYGRLPAVEVEVPTRVDRTEAAAALVDLAPAVRTLEKTAACT